MNLLEKVYNCLPWFPASVRQRWTRERTLRGPVHLIFCLADHFEPAIVPGQGEARAARDLQEQRLERWCREIPKAVQEWRDAEGFPIRHTYFYPAEQYDRGLVERLVQHCEDGWGEIEVHLHHGTKTPDTPENTRRMLLDFRDTLASHGCLSQLRGRGEPRYAFVHGNFALANSANNRDCGVDAEMRILSETGCFGDFTLPSAPNASQVAKINALYGTLPTIEGLSPLLPSLLDRLRSLRAIHADAATASEGLERVERRQTEMADDIKRWKEGLEKVEKAMKQGETVMGGNMKVVEGWVKELEQKMGKL